MARIANGDSSDANLPTDEGGTSPVAPASLTAPNVPAQPSPTLTDEAPPTNQTAARPVGSSFSDLGNTVSATPRSLIDIAQHDTPDQSSQNASNLALHANDLTTVQNNLLATVNSGQFSGADLGHVQAILSDLTSAISTANATAGPAGLFANAAGAGQAIRAAQLSMINAIDTDTVLATPAPAPADPLPTLPAETHHSLAEIGEMFDDVAGQILGGVNDDNRGQITNDINAVISDMQALMKASPELFEGETGVHADAVVQQLQLELAYINDPDISPNAVAASTDNILDIIDLVQNDSKLAELAKQDGHDGFSPIADGATPATPHPDGDAQTMFQANFIAQSNSLGQQAVALAGSNDAGAIATLIADLKAFEKSVTDIDPGQSGALGAEVAAVIKGLQTGNADLVAAAADQLHGNAADIGSSNIPSTGGAYNTNGVTVAEVLGTPTAADAPAAPAISPDDSAPVDTAEVVAPVGIDHEQAPELAQLHHMWG